MSAHPGRTVATAAVVAWSDEDPTRTVWLADCVARHLACDWGDLDPADAALNDRAVCHQRGRVLSAYRLPAELAGTTTDTRLWVITDDLDDPDTATTLLWPSDY
jgi:hypothetical protein